MPIIRPIQANHIEAYAHLANVMSLGLTSLPRDYDLQKAKINHSLQAFQSKEPTKNYYIFVLEDEGKVIGTSSIAPISGPLYSYKKERDILTPTIIEKGPTMICGLFLHPEARGENLGILLSYSRFMFMATFPERFQSRVLAEMRGVIDEGGRSPFWSYLSDKPLDETLEKLTVDSRYAETIMSKEPLYISKFPPEAGAVIGRPHPNTGAALHMLEKQGFSITPHVDIVDAGPKLETLFSDIDVVKNSVEAPVKIARTDAPKKLICNCSTDFRCAVAPALITGSHIQMNAETAQSLELDSSSPARIYI